MSDSSKAIGSLAKKQSEVTRQGTQKLKFVPTLPTRRKKEEIKTEPVSPTHAAGNSCDHTEEGRGRGRGRRLPPQPIKMTASGPFAMGPAVPRRSMSQSNAAPPLMSPASGSIARTVVPKTPFNKIGGGLKPQSTTTTEDEEPYSEPDEGVEIVDLQKVRELDWMAPETLRREGKKAKRVRKEDETKAPLEIDITNAIDLSASEGEEESERVVEDFGQANMNENSPHHEENLFFFQFPVPFPSFLSNPDSLAKKMALTLGTQSGSATSSPAPSTTTADQLHNHQTPNPVDGVIGQLEMYQSGTVKFRLSNDILLDVSTAIQPAFLQQAVYLQRREKHMIILGDVNKRFVISPDVDTLLMEMDEADKAPICLVDNEGGLVKMDAA
ncbi:hypothetical protein AX15_002167 [Amanita polypyramis BW_CC]|nr:hypothetical protein AX15_002167 [Amanita polypyramis BW_CC]